MGKLMLRVDSRKERQRRMQAAEWWLKLRTGEPTERDVAEWLDWHGRDPRNAEAFESARSLADRFRATDRKALSGLVAEFSGAPERTRFRSLSWGMRLVATTAVIAAAVVGYRSIVAPEAKPARLKYMTPVAVNREISLPDGSNVLLGAESELNASFTASARHIRLRDGEAYFKVKHEEDRPFYVRAGNLTIRDVGTAFDVLKTGGRVTVTVSEGRVQVTERDIGAQAGVAVNTVEISAGQQLLYVPGVGGLRVARVDPLNSLAWREQRLEFVDTPLSSVVDNINRYSKRPLHIGDAAIGRFSFTGTVDVPSLDRWLAALQTVFPVRVERGPESDTIVPAPSSHHR
jgi:transmembrane sensor